MRCPVNRCGAVLPGVTVDAASPALIEDSMADLATDGRQFAGGGAGAAATAP